MMNNVLFPDEITGEMLLNQNINEIPTLLEPLLPKSGLVCLAGSSDTGKSAFLRQLSMSVSAGLKAFLGMKLNVEHRSAIYVSTEDDETLQILSFAGFLIVNSAKEWVQALYGATNWVQNGCNFEILEKEKSRKFLTYRTLSWALQDGLEPTTP